MLRALLKYIFNNCFVWSQEKNQPIYRIVSVIICFNHLCHIPTLFLTHGDKWKQTHMVESNPNILPSYLK